MAETVFMGLRLLQEGLSRSAFQARFGSDPVQLYADTLADLAQRRLIHWDDQRIYLPPEAVLISNQVFVSFLPDKDGNRR
jgi:oxygen-independent coproporphyrinogen-3 oxidase